MGSTNLRGASEKPGANRSNSPLSGSERRLSAAEKAIEAARELMARTWIDEGCEQLIEAFLGYRTEEASAPGVFRKMPAHTWESHYADAWQVIAKAREEVVFSQNAPLDYSRRDEGRINV